MLKDMGQVFFNTQASPWLHAFSFTVVIVFIGLFNPRAQARGLSYTPGILLAQDFSDEAYDPFADYSEFDESSEEEADINFFRNGRFFVLGLNLGLRGFTNNLAKIYGSGPTYGISLVYFFDLRFALQMGFLTGDHSYSVVTTSGNTRTELSGNVSMTFLDILIKYYFNTAHVTRGLADLNPFMVGGFAQTFRTTSIKGAGSSRAENTVGTVLGFGMEFPILQRRSFIGIQATYRYFQFEDENQALTDPVTLLPSTVKPNGDTYDLLMTFGFNF